MSIDYLVEGDVEWGGVRVGRYKPTYYPPPPHYSTPQSLLLPPDDCQELLNGWHNFSFELMLDEELTRDDGLNVVGVGICWV